MYNFDFCKTLLITYLLTRSLTNDINRINTYFVCYMYYMPYTYTKVSYRKEFVKKIIKKIHLQNLLKKNQHVIGPAQFNPCCSRVGSTHSPLRGVRRGPETLGSSPCSTFTVLPGLSLWQTGHTFLKIPLKLPRRCCFSIIANLSLLLWVIP